MNVRLDSEILLLIGGVVVILVLASLGARALRLRHDPDRASPFFENLVARIRAWWIMVAVFTLALATGGFGTLIVFAGVSFMALREFVTITPTRRGDHRALSWAFFVLLPWQYVMVGTGMIGLFSIFIPVYGLLFLAIRAALSGETHAYLVRTSEIQWGLFVCVYFVSHAPALFLLDIPGYAGEQAKLLLFLVVVVELSDVMQYIWGISFGRTPVVPKLSPNKTVEGLIGGVLSASLLGALLWWITPFHPVQAFAVSLVICLLGFFGGLVMSAIKRDRGIKDYGTLLPGHGGMLDRIDSLCFAAPVFFHMVRFFYAS